MLEHYFKNTIAVFSTDVKLADNYWKEITTHYSGKKRHYHNLHHLDHLLQELLPIQHEISDWGVLIFSLAYHDIIYDPLKKDNEEKSAAFAKGRLSVLNMPPESIHTCVGQILATKTHPLSAESDTNYFTDADLCILGSSAERYREYATEVRQEYSIYPDVLYKPGRKKVLQHFLAMPQIFKTAFFRNKYEEKARINLQNEWSSL